MGWLGRRHVDERGERRWRAAASAESRRVPTGACGASWRNVSWCAGCVVAVVAGVLGRSMAGVVQRGDVPGARSGLIWGLGLVSFVLMAGLQLRAEGRRGVGCRGGWAEQIDTGACTRPKTCMNPRHVQLERWCAGRGVLRLGGDKGLRRAPPLS